MKVIENELLKIISLLKENNLPAIIVININNQTIDNISNSYLSNVNTSLSNEK
jgi:hypothetical protein